MNRPIGDRIIGSACLSLAALVCVWYFAFAGLGHTKIQSLVVGPVVAGGLVGWVILPRFLEPGTFDRHSFVYAGLGGLLATFTAIPLGGFAIVTVYSIIEGEAFFAYLGLTIPFSYLFLPVALPCGIVASMIAQFIVGFRRKAPDAIFSADE